MTELILSAERVVVIGGGLAGLAAAVALSARGRPVTVLESRPRLGGRASSFVDQATGEVVDNCQHVTMGCCVNFQHFCQTIGIWSNFRRENTLYFVGPDGRIDRFSQGVLPAPLHLTGAFAGLRYLTLGEKWALAQGLRALAGTRTFPPGETFAAWLQRHRQPPRVITRFWEVVLISALSETLDRIDPAYARKVFVDGFLANRDGWLVDVPTAPLDDLYGAPLQTWLENHGSEVRLQTGVAELMVDESTNQVSGVRLRDGSVLTASEYVLAVPWHRLADLLPPACRQHPTFAQLPAIETSPITSVHLWFDRPITDLPHAALVDRLSQWMFNRTQLTGRPPQPGYNYQIVISASRALSGSPAATILQRVLEELATIWPTVQAAKLVHHRVVTEHHAVFSVQPGAEALRPLQQSPLSNLQLAGDWTRTGWPATMEGAVRSGYLAAENILAHSGDTNPVLQSPLPTGTLSHWLGWT